jgi:hypothetical protein
LKGIQVCSNQGNNSSPRGDNSERVNLKKFFSRTSKPNSIILDTNYPWVKGIQVCSNKWPGPFQRGDNHKNIKMEWGHFKILFLRTMKPEKMNFI